MPPPIQFEVCSPEEPPATELIAELNAYLDAVYEPADNHFRLDPAEVAPGRGVFLVARRDGRPVGCGAVRLNDDGRGEIKRMYVRPEAQGDGVGRQLLARLEDHARHLGATAMVLEMGIHQAAARGLYEAFGYGPVPCWGEYLSTPASVCLGKDL